jgi:hypothetical protein
VDQNQPKPTLDDADKNLLTQTLSAPLKAIYDDLTAKLDRMLASQPACIGDGNIDGVVNAQDLRQLAHDQPGLGLVEHL